MFRERARTLRAMSLSLDAICITIAFGAALVLRVFHDQIPGLRTLIAARRWAGENGASEGYAERMEAEA